ncbi:hypothetical protein ERJ75_001815600 [Trypanosoma vivax]|nr:hypothetical protein ERJ75_001815600 [Trypanosoma vivax]
MSTARRKVEVGGPQGVRGESRAGQETEEKKKGKVRHEEVASGSLHFFALHGAVLGVSGQKGERLQGAVSPHQRGESTGRHEGARRRDAAKGIAKGTLEGLRLAASGVAGVNATRVTACAEEMGLLAAGKVSEKTRGAAAGAEARRLRQLVLTVKEGLTKAEQLHATGKRRALDALYGAKKTDVKDDNFHCKAQQASSLSSGNTPLTSNTHGIGQVPRIRHSAPMREGRRRLRQAQQ